MLFLQQQLKHLRVSCRHCWKIGKITKNHEKHGPRRDPLLQEWAKRIRCSLIGPNSNLVEFLLNLSSRFLKLVKPRTNLPLFNVYLQQKPIKQTFFGSLRRDTHWKCLMLTVLILGCLVAISWCRLSVTTRTVLNYYEMSVSQANRAASPCDDGWETTKKGERNKRESPQIPLGFSLEPEHSSQNLGQGCMFLFFLKRKDQK